MTIPSPDVPTEGVFGASLEEFRSALASELGRKKLGIDISEEDAASVAADAQLSASWHKLWQLSVREYPMGAAQDRTRATAEHPRKYDWEQQLPVRFNPPPGWPTPNQDWILQHVGLEMCDAWRPPGAPTFDPPGWLWWVPQEPAWTAWIRQHDGADDQVRGFAVAFGVCAALACSLPLVGWALGSLLAVMCAIGSGAGLARAIVSRRHFRRDPLGELRDNHTQVAQRLSYAATVGDGHHVDFADLTDFADLFDGE